MLPLTGTNAVLGENLSHAIQLALDFENGQVAGYTIKLIIEDEGDHDSAAALDKAKKLVASDKIDLMLGPYQANFASAILPYLASLPMIDVKFTSPLSQDEIKNDYCFWTAPRFQDYSYPLGIFASANSIKTISSIGSDSPAATGYTEGFVLGFQNSGGKLIQQQWVPITSTNFISSISELGTTDATLCGVLGDPAKSIFLTEYTQFTALQNVPVFLLEPNSFLSQVPQELDFDNNLDRVMAIQGYTPSLDNTENQKFVQAFQSQFNIVPDAGICEAYNGMRIIIEALKETGGNTNPSVLKQALLKTQINLPTGQFRFSQNRTGLEPLRVCSLRQIDNVLQWVYLKEYPTAEYYQPLIP
jgi:branched-chain amino acid transport system substrate-binding protein